MNELLTECIIREAIECLEKGGCFVGSPTIAIRQRNPLTYEKEKGFKE